MDVRGDLMRDANRSDHSIRFLPDSLVEPIGRSMSSGIADTVRRSPLAPLMRVRLMQTTVCANCLYAGNLISPLPT